MVEQNRFLGITLESREEWITIRALEDVKLRSLSPIFDTTQPGWDIPISQKWSVGGIKVQVKLIKMDILPPPLLWGR
ncbi:hypothetical protein PMI35_01122 [Pseudomonas sp. GM78]|nr:hypothetical protein PMI35_01122 [Pseudomonas sp. GM78]